MTFDPTAVKLGRKAVVHDPRTLRFAKYLKPEKLPKPPSSYNSGTKVQRWGMLANDKLGDCTCAGILHMIMLWRSSDGPAPMFYDNQAIDLYIKLCGYQPGKPETDQGGIELNILNAWRKEPIVGTPLAAYVAVDPKNWEHVKLAHWLFGSLYLGLDLPVEAQGEKVWSDTSGKPGTWGGHCVITNAYNDEGFCLSPKTLSCITWGEEQKMTQKWVAKYCDEMYALLSPDWVGQDGAAPNGFNIDQLSVDLNML